MKEFADRINPYTHGYSPKLTMLVGAIIGHDYGVRDSRSGKWSNLTITSDGYVICESDIHASGAFIGSVEECQKNLDSWKKNLSREDILAFDQLYTKNVKDWRTR